MQHAVSGTSTTTALLPAPFAVGSASPSLHPPPTPTTTTTTHSPVSPSLAPTPANSTRIPDHDASGASDSILVDPPSLGGSKNGVRKAQVDATGAGADHRPRPQAQQQDAAALVWEEDGIESEQERQVIVDKVLERAKVSKMVRAFQTRLALAFFKTERGWQNHRLDEIEPHIVQVERDAAATRQREKEAASFAQRQQYQQHLHSYSSSTTPTYSDELMGPPQSQSGVSMTPTPSASGSASGPGVGMKRGASLASLSNVGMANPTMYDQHGYQQPQTHFQQHPHPQQQQQQQQQQQHHQYASVPLHYAQSPHEVYAHSPYADQSHFSHPMDIPYQHQPIPSTSSLQPAVHLQHHQHPQQQHAFPMHQQQPPPPQDVSDSHRQKRRMTMTAAENNSHHPGNRHSPPPRRPMSAGPSHVSPRMRNYHSAPMGSIGGGGGGGGGGGRKKNQSQQPLSSSDPNFSSFVDAASVLTGLSRGPSESSVLGSTSEEMAVSSSLPNGVGSGIPRPRTPVRGDENSAKGGMKGSEWNENAHTADDAAELMLFLAASPSPAQARTSRGVQLGLGEEGMKGRRLFATDDSAMGSGLMDDSRVSDDPFGSTNGTSHMDHARPTSGPGATPFSTSSSSNSNNPSIHHSASLFDYHPSSLASSIFPSSSSTTIPTNITSSSSYPHSPPPQASQKGPMTPSRSANGSTGWDSFLNVSPTPSSRTSGAFGMGMTSAMPLGGGRGHVDDW